ncbi:MAG: hypothetical protein M1814_000922 [Vezdaea aestivalis]|nr:MAG: hypothetical protein M1814_000922 [Vezdaea aestivalis]
MSRGDGSGSFGPWATWRASLEQPTEVTPMVGSNDFSTGNGTTRITVQLPNAQNRSAHNEAVDGYVVKTRDRELALQAQELVSNAQSLATRGLSRRDVQIFVRYGPGKLRFWRTVPLDRLDFDELVDSLPHKAPAFIIEYQQRRAKDWHTRFNISSDADLVEFQRAWISSLVSGGLVDSQLIVRWPKPSGSSAEPSRNGEGRLHEDIAPFQLNVGRVTSRARMGSWSW